VPIAMDTKELKKLTERFGLERLESCIQQQLAQGANDCTRPAATNEVIETLSKAGVVREMMDQGMTFSDALRELGRKIRAVYGKNTDQ
jgi:hypothetical protein